MEITHFGTNRGRITIVYNPQRILITPRIIDKTRWIILSPDLLPPLQDETAGGWRASGLSSCTWQAIQRAYLLEAHPITRHSSTLIYSFGHMASSVTLIHTPGEEIRPQRIGNTSVVVCGRHSSQWLHHLIERTPRRTQSAIPYLKEHGLRPSSVFLHTMFRDIPKFQPPR